MPLGWFRAKKRPANMKPDTPSAPELPRNPVRASKAGIGLIHSFEGCKLEAYPDPGTGSTPWTIGWGTTRIDGKPVVPGMKITQEEADRLFVKDLRKFEDDVSAAIGLAPTSQAQFDAMVSFHYNTGAIGRSTLLRKHKAGDFAGAEREFHRWTRAGGKVMRGLVRRRAAEAAIYKDGSL